MPFLDKHKLVIDVQFDATVFVAGSEITGSVKVVALDDIELRGIVLQYEVLYSGVRRFDLATERQLHVAEQMLFGSRNGKEQKFLAGNASYNFRVATKAELPPTMMQFAESCGQCRHQLTVEAVIPYSWSDYRTTWDVHVMKGVHPAVYLSQPARECTQSEPVVHCGQCCDTPNEWWAMKCALPRVEQFRLSVRRTVISLLNDREIPFQLRGQLRTRYSVALIRSYRFKGHETRSVVSSISLPRPSQLDPNEANPIIDAFIPLQLDRIGDTVSVVDVNSRYLSIRYFVGVLLHPDEGVCPGIPAQAQQLVPVTIVHCIHERAPIPPAEAALAGAAEALLVAPMVPAAMGGVVSSTSARRADVEALPSQMHSVAYAYAPPSDSVGYQPAAPVTEPGLPTQPR